MMFHAQAHLKGQTLMVDKGAQLTVTVWVEVRCELFLFLIPYSLNYAFRNLALTTEAQSCSKKILSPNCFHRVGNTVIRSKTPELNSKKLCSDTFVRIFYDD